jgi:hypothetical protein
VGVSEADAADAVTAEVAGAGWSVAVRLAAAVLIAEAGAVGEAATAAGLEVGARPGGRKPQASATIKSKGNIRRTD